MSNIISQTISTIKNWWLFLLTGILIIAVAIYILTTPTESYVTLAWIFSILVLASGLSNVYFSISNHKQLEGWGWYLAGGIFEVIIGLVLIYYPNISIITLPLFVAFWLMFRGAQIIGVSLDLKKLGILDWGWFMILGIALVLNSLFMFLLPLFGWFNVIYLTFIALMIFGVSNIMLSLKLKKIKSKTIDKVESFKKDIKHELNLLKSNVLENMQEATKEQKSKIDAFFDEHASKLK